jgi:hypothetical protein
MQVQSVNSQSFCGLQCHPNYSTVEYILATKLGWNGFSRADKYLEKLAKNHTNVDVFLGGELTKKPKICAEVGGKTIKEGWFFGPLSVLKKALKLSNKLDAQK